LFLKQKIDTNMLEKLAQRKVRIFIFLRDKPLRKILECEKEDFANLEVFLVVAQDSKTVVLNQWPVKHTNLQRISLGVSLNSKLSLKVIQNSTFLITFIFKIWCCKLKKVENQCSKRWTGKRVKKEVLFFLLPKVLSEVKDEK
jgi:hypothetical protein